MWDDTGDPIEPEWSRPTLRKVNGTPDVSHIQVETRYTDAECRGLIEQNIDDDKVWLIMINIHTQSPWEDM